MEHRLDGEDLVCPPCGEPMAEIGKEIIKTLEIIPVLCIVLYGYQPGQGAKHPKEFLDGFHGYVGYHSLQKGLRWSAAGHIFVGSLTRQ